MNLSPEQQAWNDFLTLMNGRDKDTPAKRWFHAPTWHPSIGRALGIDRDQDGGRFALAPFRITKIDEAWHIIAAWPTPTMIGPAIDEDWLGIEAVIAWNPVTNAVHVIGDDQAQLIGSFDTHYGDGTLYGQPRPFFQAWAQNRARFFGFASQHIGKAWTAMPAEPDLIPGCMIVGNVNHVRWQPARMPAHLECVGVDPVTVNKALMRSTHLPRATQSTRIAA